MQLSLKLWQKGFVLVAVPLVFEFTFVIALAAMLEQVEKERRAEAHSKAIVTQSNDLSKDAVDAASSIVALYYTGNRAMYDRAGESIAHIRTGMDELENLTAENPDQRRHVEKLKVLSERVRQRLWLYREDCAKGDHGVDFLRFRKELHAAYQPFFDELHILSSGEKLAQTDAPRAEQARKQRLIEFLYTGLAINVLIAIFLALFFRGITRRLRLLRDNAKLLGRKMPLHKPLQGTDEIADLDGVFHEMAAALTTAETRKQEFVSTICHDLRSPLANVQVTLATAGRGTYGQLNEKGLDRFENAERSIEHLLSLLNELLDAERMEAGMLELAFTNVDLKSVLDQSIETVKALAEERSIKLETPETDLKIAADSKLLIRVLVNLLSNAIKFSPSGGVVSVAVVPNADDVEIQVKDQGKGIAAGDTEKVFDRFRRVGDTTDFVGIGLGLSICKAIIEAHGGEIGVTSTTDKGSTFWFRLPIRKPAE